jgi:hypothetical protein
LDTTGLDSFAGAGRDIDVVFEIEREIGDFYQGWDEEGDIEEEEEEELKDDERTESIVEDAIVTSPTVRFEGVPFPTSSSYGMPRSATIPVDMGMPAKDREVSKKRRGSLPPTERPGESSILIGGASPRKRRGSIVEPSPLARLFVRSPPTESFIPRALGHRSSLSASLGQTANAFTRGFIGQSSEHGRHKSLSGPMPSAISTALETIPSGKRVSFSNQGLSALTKNKDEIATASSLQQELLETSAPAVSAELDNMRQKLDSIEAQQKQITKMLQRILATSSSSAAEGRRESTLSPEGI